MEGVYYVILCFSRGVSGAMHVPACALGCVFRGVHGSELVDCVYYIGIDEWMTACMSLEVFQF